MLKFINDFWPLILGIILGSIFGTILGNAIVYWGSH